MSAASDAAKIKEIAVRLGTNPAWLDALINFETAGTYDPLIAGSSVTGAHGLIQIIDSTARSEFDYPDSLSLVRAYSNFDDQMEYVVYPYLAKYKPFPTQQSLYMAVFYPKYRFVDPQTPFPASVTAVNRNIYTPADYIQFVNSRIKTDALHNFGLPLVALAGTAAVVWALMKARVL